MRHILLAYFLGMAVFCHAQKCPKNELSVGFPGGYFFDSTAFKMLQYKSDLAYTYTRNLTSSISVSATYASYFFKYVSLAKRLPDNTIIKREIQRVSLSGTGVYNLPAGWFQFRFKGGLNYCWGAKLNHYNYFPFPFGEPVWRSASYNKMGLITGLGIEHKIVWGLFGGFNADYVRMFKGIDPNQLYLSYSLGYRF